MPKKKPGMTPEEQSKAFERFVQEQVEAGELSLTEANAALDRLIADQGRRRENRVRSKA